MGVDELRVVGQIRCDLFQSVAEENLGPAIISFSQVIPAVEAPLDG
jgi:hypothetical protein